ncbi:hypothetical protein RJ55_02619 [Drechmeria coniospora]|nr:hypothetical protein RJ55_02619 [Drechmeria coniospora]
MQTTHGLKFRNHVACTAQTPNPANVHLVRSLSRPAPRPKTPIPSVHVIRNYGEAPEQANDQLRPDGEALARWTEFWPEP